MTKQEQKIDMYKIELLKYVRHVDDDLLEAIVKYLGPSIFKADAELVATNDPEELKTVKNSFLKNKLNLSHLNEEELDSAIEEVRDIFGSSNNKKYRALFYYLLTLKFGMKFIFVDEEIDVDKIVNKLSTNEYDNKSLFWLYLAVVIDLIVIWFLSYLLFY